MIKFLSYHNFSFADLFGDFVKFDALGNGIGQYNIMNYRQNLNTGKYEFLEVGEWKNFVTIRPNEIRWINGQPEVPSSACSRPCRVGEIKMFGRRSCCWVCIPCKENEITLDQKTCQECDEGSYPDEDRRTCHKINVKVDK